jgi:hypothetical protein
VWFQGIVPNALAACLGALVGYFGAMILEWRKESRTRYAIATVLQAELIRLHHKLKEHNALLSAYAGRFSNLVNEPEAVKSVPIGIEDEFVVYKSCIKEIGLLGAEAARETVYCYGNLIDFLSAQETFLRDLPGIATSNMLGLKAQNLCDRESAALQQIPKAIHLLAEQSSPLPFRA